MRYILHLYLSNYNYVLSLYLSIAIDEPYCQLADIWKIVPMEALGSPAPSA
jgi:hypothetical protein